MCQTSNKINLRNIKYNIKKELTNIPLPKKCFPTIEKYKKDYEITLTKYTADKLGKKRKRLSFEPG